MELNEMYHLIVKTLIERNITITTMESCTSGFIASLITDTEGASAIFTGSFVTYSNAVKELVGVDASVIETFGVYSKETAEAMAKCAQEKLHTDIGIGITGTFGNVDPNNKDSYPGSVHYAVSYEGTCNSYFEEIPVQNSRHAYKEYIAAKLGETLLQLLNIQS